LIDGRIFAMLSSAKCT